MAKGSLETPIAPGRRFAGYELESPVARSGIGVVYRARDLRLGREVALRIIAPEIANDPVTRARLNRASIALASVDHPNVLPIYEASESNGQLFIATRWVDGIDLGALVREQGPLEPRRAVRIVNQVASALQAAHDSGIMHRNVKPSSVLVTAGDHAYLTDFGLARRASDLTGLTMHERLVESFDYLAPEYIEGSPVDARVDIYGLGCVLYEALTGEVPYPAPTPAAKMYAQRSADPPSARARRPDLPEILDAVVRRAMAKEPSERFQSPGEFAAEAAGAVGLSAPLWVTRAPTPPAVEPSDALKDGGPPPERPSSQPEVHDDGHNAPEPRPGATADEWSETTYFARPSPGGTRRVATALAILLFLAAPIALVLAVVLH